MFLLESIDADIAEPVAVKNEEKPGTIVKPYEPETLITKLPEVPLLIIESANTLVVVGNTYFNSEIGEVIFYGSALTLQNITDIYNNTKSSYGL